MAVVDIDDEGVVIPFASSILGRDLLPAGMPTGDALALARRVGDELASHGQPVVSSAVLGSEAARQLAACGEYGVLRRLRVLVDVAARGMVPCQRHRTGYSHNHHKSLLQANLEPKSQIALRNVVSR